MQYTIIHELPGRLRVRCGMHAFRKDQIPALCAELGAVHGVDSIDAHAANGGILIHYELGQRDSILSMLSQIETRELPVIVPTLEPGAEEKEDRSFAFKIAKALTIFFAGRFLLPVQLRFLLTLWRFREYLVAAARSLSHLRLDVPVLDGVAIGASIATGQSASARSIMLMLQISDKLQEHTQRKTKIALTDSLAVQVDQVWLLHRGQEVGVPLSDLKKGDKIVVRTGAMIPVDGVVVHGEAAVNEASMTGESTCSHKRPGVSVYAGTTIEEGGLTIKVSAVDKDTRISRIMHLIEESEELKAKIQSEAEHLADKIVPYSLLTAAVTGAVTRNTQRALSVLMVDYSCALKLSTPIAVLSAMREATAIGALVKGGRYLEAMAEADTIVFDKTGTLTTATPKVVKVVALGDYSENEVLRTAACIEEHFPHSMAQAIVQEAKRRHLKHEEFHSEVNYIVAHGVNTSIDGKRASVGSSHYIFEDEQIPLDKAERKHLEEMGEGLSCIYLAIGGQVAGCIYLEDEPREEAIEVVKQLRAAGIEHIIMLTGDSKQAAKVVSKKLGITEYRAQVLPEDKAAYIQELKDQGRRVIMVGDGVNDSPAMSCADVSVSMKNAADLAREISDITLLSNSLKSLVELRVLSQQALARIRSNYRVIIGINTGLIALGSLGLMTPFLSALLHNLSTFAVCLHSTTGLRNGGFCHMLPQLQGLQRLLGKS